MNCKHCGRTGMKSSKDMCPGCPMKDSAAEEAAEPNPMSDDPGEMLPRRATIARAIARARRA